MLRNKSRRSIGTQALGRRRSEGGEREGGYETGEEEGAKEAEFLVCRLLKAFADKNKNKGYFLVVGASEPDREYCDKITTRNCVSEHCTLVTSFLDPI